MISRIFPYLKLLNCTSSRANPAAYNNCYKFEKCILKVSIYKLNTKFLNQQLSGRKFNHSMAAFWHQATSVNNY